ncbi:hypothetical protein [Streptomyces sp. OE57]|uniref:hypothetical protein n=1 Tax=Streptomyces lacaronensis TaxID=3379885 RepID=UPI0039B74015
MNAAHLHAVPDHDDAPTRAPAAVTASGEGAAAVERLAAIPAPAYPPEEVEEDRAAEAGDEPEGLGDEEESGELEEGGPRRALALPDLRPYVTVNRATAKELGFLAAEVTRTTAPRVRRGLAPVARGLWWALRTGTTVLALVLRGWFSGELAPKVPPLWRLLLGPLVLIAGLAQTVATYPRSPILLVAAWPLLAVIAQRWAAGQVQRAAKAKASGKDGKEPAKASGKTTGKGAAKASGKSAARSFAARLAAALERPSPEASPEAPAEASPEAAEEPSAEAAGEVAKEASVEAAGEVAKEASVEAPAAPSREDIVRALHALVGGSSGVLHTALRDRLRYPSTRAVREALEAANIPSRPGVRAVGGNGPGVNRRDFPPLPPPREGSPGSGVVAGQQPTTTPTTLGEGPREGLDAEGSDPGRAYTFDVIPDTDRGPSSWKIIPHD